LLVGVTGSAATPIIEQPPKAAPFPTANGSEVAGASKSKIKV